MSRPILIAHATGDEKHAENLADSIVAAGYEVVHSGTVLVGESLIEEANRALMAGAPVVLCGTIRAMGTSWAHRMVNAARGVNPATRIYGVAIEQDAYLLPLSLDGKIAEYWRDKVGALESVVAALLQHYPPSSLGAAPVQDREAASLRYRELLLSNCDIINLANLPADRRLVTQHLALRNLFLPLMVSGNSGVEDPATATKLGRMPGDKSTGGPVPTDRTTPVTHPPGARLDAARRLVVLGDPGSGKSTLLRWMATTYLLRLRGDPAWRDLPAAATLPDEDWLPILVRCRDLSLAQVDGTFDDVLLNVLRRAELPAADVEVMRTYLNERLTAGTALLLIDGLDEISDPRLRIRFCELLARVHLSRPKAPMVVTSRTVGYREMSRGIGPGFEDVTIADLDGSAKDEFIRRWCLVTEPPELQKQAADGLIADVHGTDRIERLTANAMMLTTLALVKRQVGKLPNHRADLYGAAVEVLLNWRSDVDEPLDAREAEPQLQYLAYAMSDRGVQQLTEDEILDLLDAMRSEYPHLRSVHRSESAKFLRLLERRTAIVVEKGHVRHEGRMVPLFEFRHLTFQEYLTAQAMVKGVFPSRDRSEDLATRVGRLVARMVGDDSEDTWQEVTRLCVSLCHGDDVDRVLSAVLTEHPVLAARCLEDEPNAGTAMVGAILRALVQAVPPEAPWDSPAVKTVKALARTTWAPVLREELVAELRSRGPLSVRFMGRLIGQALSPPNYTDLAVRRTALVAGLRSGGDEPLIAALIFGAQASADDDVVILPAAELLELLGQSDRVVAEAAAWAMSRTQPTNGGGWWPSDHEIDRMITLAPAGEAERTILLSLIDAAGSRRWPNALNLLGKFAEDRVAALRGEAIWLLGYTNEEAALPMVTSAFADDDSDVRHNAASGLRSMRSSAARPALIAALDDEDSDVRAAAARSLGELGESPATGKLLAALEDSASAVRVQAALALAGIGESPAVAPLTRLLSSKDNHSWEFVDALRRTSDGEALLALLKAFGQLPAESASWAVFTFGDMADHRALSTVRRCLAGETPHAMSPWAVSALGRLTEADPSDRALIESALTADDPGMRRESIRALGNIGDDAARNRVAELVADESAEVRRAVADVLADSDSESTLAAKRHLAADENPMVRTAAMKSNKSGLTGEGLEILATGLRDPDPQVRKAAAESLRDYDDSRAVDLLTIASRDPVAQVRQGAATALRQPYLRPLTDTLLHQAQDRDPEVRAAALESLGLAGGPGVLARLDRKLRASDPAERTKAAVGLGLLRDDRAIPPLTAALDDHQPAVRREAATALGNLASEPAAEILVGRAADPSAAVRLAVANALGVAAVAAGQPVLRTLLDDPHPAVRAAAANAIGELGQPERIDALLPLLADSHPLVRRNAIWALDDDSAVEPLIRRLEDPVKWVRGAACWILGIVGAVDAAPRLRTNLATVYGNQRATTLEALSRIEGTTALPLLTEALDDPHPAVRRVAVRELRRARSDAPVVRLRAALADPESEVRAEAPRTLTGLHDRGAVPMLIDRLQHDPVPRVRTRSCGALARLDAREGREPIVAMLDHPDFYLRETAAWAVALFGDPEPMAGLRAEYPRLTAEGRRSLIGSLANLGDPQAKRLMNIGLAAPSRIVRLRWMKTFRADWRDQLERDLLTRYGDGYGPEIDPQTVIDRRRIERMARALWRTPEEIRGAYIRLSAEIPLQVLP